MSAEVAIMNGKGIALAADSAVTFTKTGKIYNSADKLFALSKYHPVGIMVYNNMSIMGVDWEIIIKSYRDSLGNKSFDKFSEYETDFIKYLSKFPYFTEEEMIDYLGSICLDCFSGCLTSLLYDLRKEFNDKENIELSEINALFDKTLQEIKEIWEQLEDQIHIKEDSDFIDSDDFIDSNIETINETLKTVFENYKLSSEQTAELINSLKLYIKKNDSFKEYSGIVIAGYGEKEIFPTVSSFMVSGKLGERLIYFDRSVTQIGTSILSSIIPFAQRDMVHQFIWGVDDSFSDAAIEKVKTILDSLLPLISDTDKEKKDGISKLFSDYLYNFSAAVFKDPIVNIVSLMDKNEMVSMAEALVSLTALKRHVSEDADSVGGPIDVALITKGEGFIWIKKKTNYDPHLNRHLNQSYFRGYKNGNL